MSQNGNAEASSSRLPRSIISRRKSQDALTKAASESLSGVTSPAPGDKTKTQLPRAVKTVPRESPLCCVASSVCLSRSALASPVQTTAYLQLAQLSSRPHLQPHPPNISPKNPCISEKRPEGLRQRAQNTSEDEPLASGTTPPIRLRTAQTPKRLTMSRHGGRSRRGGWRKCVRGRCEKERKVSAG